MPLVRDALTLFFRAVTGIFFREVEVMFAPASDTRGRLFAANHVNGIVDPILVLTQAPFPVAPVAKSTLWKIPILRSLLDAVGAVPVVRKKDDPGAAGAAKNDEVFDRVAAHFGRGGNVLIFPEGVSHSEPHLVPVKTGPARMLARARAQGQKGLTFQAIALEFDARESFRSRALLVFGPVREVDPLPEEGLVERITEQIRDDLSELMVEGESWEDRTLIARVAELLAHDSGDRSLAQWNAIGRQVEAARKVAGDAQVQHVREAVDAYYAQLARSGVRDDHLVAGVKARPGRLGRALGLALLAPLALFGGLAYLLPYQVPKLAARFAGDERDVVSTYKLGLGLAAFPLWFLVGSVGAWLALPTTTARLLAVAALAVSPFAALVFLDRLDPVRAQWSTTPASDLAPARLEELRLARRRATDAIESVRREFEVGAGSAGAG